MLVLGYLNKDVWENKKISTQEEIKQHIASTWEVKPQELENLAILVAFEDYEEYLGEAFYLVINKDNDLLAVYGSHCSCYGFEGQWKLEPITTDYINSDYFSVGYNTTKETVLIKEFVKTLNLEFLN